MRAGIGWALALAILCSTMGDALAASGEGQPGYAPHNYTTAPMAQPATGYERTSGRNNPAANYYSAGRKLSYAPPMRAAAMPPARTVVTAPPAKPFNNVYQASTISPYLSLDVRESEAGLPNYYMYVKPQLDQQRLNQVQQAQYRRLQQQVRTASAAGAVVSPNGGIPTTGHSSQFMNIGGYYPGKR